MEEPLDEELLGEFPESARPEIVALAEAARIASRETFGPFNDAPESEFYEAEGSPRRRHGSVSRSPLQLRVAEPSFSRFPGVR